MAQVAACELDSWQGHNPSLAVVGAIFPAEGDGTLINGNHAGIADGRARDIGAEVLDSAHARASWLDVHAPALAPDFRVHLPIVFLEQPVHVLPEGRLQVGQVQQELRPFNHYKLPLIVEARSRH